MTDGSNLQALKEHILARSEATDFRTACREWDPIGVYMTEEFDHCPCGQQIKEHCETENRVNGAQTFVGNVCIKRFLGISHFLGFTTAQLLAGLKRVRDKPTANANGAVIAYAEKRGYLYEKELAFLRETISRRILSEKQLAWKAMINRRILQGIVVRRLPGRT